MDGSPILVVKLGGSLITNKRARASLREDALKRAASQLAGAQDGVSLVVVHGAGSFGHHEAKEHGLRQGGQSGAHPRHVAVGEALTRAAVRTLNAHVCTALALAGIPVCAISPADCGTVTGGFGAHIRKSGGLDEAVRAALARGQVPVIHGDVVPDEASLAAAAPQPVSILSGDVILRHLALHLTVAAAVTVSDVPGLILPSKAGFTDDAPLIRVVAITASLATAPVAANPTTPGPTEAAAAAAKDVGVSASSVLAEPDPDMACTGSALVELGHPCELCLLRVSVPPPGSDLPMVMEPEGDWGRHADVRDSGGADVGVDIPDVTGGMHGKVWELCRLAGAVEQDACAVMLLGLGGVEGVSPLRRLASQLSMEADGLPEGWGEAAATQLTALGVCVRLASRVAGVRGTLVTRVK